MQDRTFRFEIIGRPGASAPGFFIMQLRDYQKEALDQILDDLSTSRTALCVMPTGAGKTELFIALIDEVLRRDPLSRVVVLVNKIKLLEQTKKRFAKVFGEGSIGIYCGSAGFYETGRPITIASIQSIHDIEVDDLGLIVLDEVHNVDQESGRYRDFLTAHPEARIAAFTATPYRSDGYIYGESSLFKGVTFQKSLTDMIESGFLVRPTMKRPDHQHETASLRIRAGEFMAEDVARLVADRGKIGKQIADALPRMEGRRSVVWACANIDHCEMVRDALRDCGELAVGLHSNMTTKARDASQEAFESGKARHMVFVSIVSEGYDYPPIDCVVLMRPIKSPVLYVQTVGRGLRPAEGKENLLVLDYGRVIETVGPLDKPLVPQKGSRKSKPAPMKHCPKCFEYVAMATRECPVCLHQFIADSSPLKSLTVKAREGIDLLSSKIRFINVRSVSMARVISKNGNECLKISYHPDNLIEPAINEFFVWSTEWGYKKAQRRLMELGAPLVADCREQAKKPIMRKPSQIHVDISGKFPDIKKVLF